jgi:hypothetical protein
MGNLSAKSQTSMNVAVKGGFALTPPTLLSNYKNSTPINVGTIQQRLVLTLPSLSSGPMQPFHFCENTESAVRDFQQQFRLPVTGQISRSCWDTLFLNGIRTASVTIKPDSPQGKRYVLVSPALSASYLVPVTHQNPLKLIAWGAAIPTPNPNGGYDLADIELNAEWNDKQDGIDVSLEISKDYLKVYSKLGFAADRIIPTLNGNEVPELSGGVEVDLSSLKNFPTYLFRGASMEHKVDSLEFGLSQGFELFHLKVVTKQTLELGLEKSQTEKLPKFEFQLQVTLP